jgi:hypothetical protein
VITKVFLKLVTDSTTGINIRPQKGSTVIASSKSLRASPSRGVFADRCFSFPRVPEPGEVGTNTGQVWPNAVRSTGIVGSPQIYSTPHRPDSFQDEKIFCEERRGTEEENGGDKEERGDSRDCTASPRPPSGGGVFRHHSRSNLCARMSVMLVVVTPSASAPGDRQSHGVNEKVVRWRGHMAHADDW